MSVRLSLLAILNQGSCYGYQLRYEFERRTGGIWPLNVGQIYQTLERLERHGLVTKGAASQQGHQYYAITEAGQEQLAEWMGTPVARDAAPRDELVIKLALAANLPGVDAHDVIHKQRQAIIAKLQEFALTKETAGEPEDATELAGSLVVDSMIYQAEAELRWLDHVETKLRAATEASLPTKLPLETDLPKRGRPRTYEDAFDGERPSGIPASLILPDF